MFAAHVQSISPIATHDGGLLNAVSSRMVAHAVLAADRLRRARCGLGGHAMLLHFEADRLSLQCMSCGHNTPGWSIRDRG